MKLFHLISNHVFGIYDIYICPSLFLNFEIYPPPYFLWNKIYSKENKTKTEDDTKTKQIHMKIIATIISTLGSFF